MTTLYGWLRKFPRPTAVMADETRIELGKGLRCWQELVESVETLEPTRVRCLAADGSVLRAKTFDDGGDKSAVSHGEDDVQVFAKLIAEAYEKGTKSYAPLLDSAMTFIERQGQSLARAEAEIEKLRLMNVKLRTELAQLTGPPDDDAGGLVGAVLAGIQQAQQLPANGGKAKTK